MTGFGGFPPETTRFLLQLRANNHKGWLDAHRADYEAFWLAPAKAFVLAAGELLAELVPGIRAEPRVLGSIFRINRDTRFARDPRPYKDHIDFWFWEGDRRRAVSGFFARLTPEIVGVGADCHGFDPERLGRFRRAVADPAGGRRPGRRRRAGRRCGAAGGRRLPAGRGGAQAAAPRVPQRRPRWAVPAPQGAVRPPRRARRRPGPHRRDPGRLRAALAGVGAAAPLGHRQRAGLTVVC